MIAWLAQSLLASAILMLAVMAVRTPLRAWLGAKMAYALWLLPLVRLAMPRLPIPGWSPLLSMQDAQPVAGPGLASATTSATGGGAAIDWPLLAIAVWAAGAVLHLAWHACRYRRFTRQALAGAAGERVRMGSVDVRTSAFVEGPVAAGIVRRLIFLPLDFDRRFDREERRLAIAHELMHHRRNDIVANLAALVVLSIHWFNPFAHLAHRLFRLDQEMACDADVLTAEGAGRRQAYGRTLAKAAIRGPGLSISALSGVDLLKRRLRGLGRPDRHLRTARPAIIMLIGGGLVLTAPLAAFSPPAAPKPLPEPADVRTTVAKAPAAGADHGLATAPRRVHHRRIALRRSPPVAQTVPELAETSSRVEPPEEPMPVELAMLAHTDPAYLAARREQRLAASRRRFASPVEAAMARGHPLIGATTSD